MHVLLQPPVYGTQECPTKKGCKELNGYLEEQRNWIGLHLGFHKFNDTFRADPAHAFNDPA